MGNVPETIRAVNPPESEERTLTYDEREDLEYQIRTIARRDAQEIDNPNRVHLSLDQLGDVAIITAFGRERTSRELTGETLDASVSTLTYTDRRRLFWTYIGALAFQVRS